MELVLAFAAGLLTLINPCVLPVLPLAIASAVQRDRYGPVALAGGMALAFVGVGLALAALGTVAGLDGHGVARIGAFAMVGFGMILIVPLFNRRFVAVTSGLSGHADDALHDIKRTGLTSHLLAGALLGAVWSPCIGPTFGGALALASQGGSLARAGAIMAAFALGVATLILLLSYGTRQALVRRRDLLRTISTRATPVMGAVLVALGVSIAFEWHYRLEAMLLDAMPVWLQDLSVAL